MNPGVLGLFQHEIEDAVRSLAEPSYRARQVATWIYEKHATGYDVMTSLPVELRDKLSESLPFPVLDLVKHEDSTDGTVKFGWSLRDGERVETVFIPMKGHSALCVSSQAGCKYKCAFCASGVGGLKRSLDCGEIIGQFLYSQRQLPERISHVVFMGVGEPFDNYDNVLKAVRLLNSETGFNIAARRLTISTCGLVPEIRQLAHEGLQIELSVSLHAPNDEIRNLLMPVNRKHPIKSLIRACREYAELTNRQITFEYVLIDGLTDTDTAALQLAGMLSGWLCKVNLIPLNPVVESEFRPPSRERADRFKTLLAGSGVHATLRSPRGRDISAACGQLRHTPG